MFHVSRFTAQAQTIIYGVEPHMPCNLLSVFRLQAQHKPAVPKLIVVMVPYFSSILFFLALPECNSCETLRNLIWQHREEAVAENIP